MRKTLCSILLLVLFVSVSLRAQNAVKGVSFDVAVSAGYSSLGHKTTTEAYPDLNATSVGDYGASAHLGVNVFVTHIFGFSLGCDFTRYGGSIGLTGKQTWSDVTDTDGERYNHTLSLYKWRERQQQLFVSPQFLLQFVIPANTVRTQIALGVEYNFNLQSAYRAKGDLEHTGTYLPWNLTLHDVDAHGFYRNTSYQPNGALQNGGQYLSLVAKVGTLIPLARNLDLSLNLVGKYALYANPKTATISGGNELLGFREDAVHISEEAVRAHYFIPQYSSLFCTSLAKGTYRPLYIGLEVGIRYTIPFRKHYPCRCIAY